VVTTQEQWSGAKTSSLRLRRTPLPDTSRNWHMVPQRHAHPTCPCTDTVPTFSRTRRPSHSTCPTCICHGTFTWALAIPPSRSMNDVVNTVRKMECRKQGHPSCAKRDMNREEYRKTMRIMGPRHEALRYRENHIIARTDDITNIETVDLRSHDKSGAFAL
jgi:hypothetical protein